MSELKEHHSYYQDASMSYSRLMTVEQVILSLKTGLNPRNHFRLNDGGSCPYITGKDIYDNTVNVTDRTDRISSDVVNLINRRACLSSNDVLFASTGTGTVGRMAVIDHYDGTWSISETLYCLKPNLELITPHYLMFALYSSKAKEQFEPKISKASVPHLKMSDLLKVKIPVPSLKEQERVISCLRSIKELELRLSNEISLRSKQFEHYRNRLIEK